MSSVEEYIRANWHRATYKDEPGTGFGGVDLPYRYTSASIKGEGRFTFFFYWDTCFTAPGLLAHGHHDLVRDNILNMLWLIERQGYMPNHVGIYNRSQAPFLCRMVEDYLSVMRAMPTYGSSGLPARETIAELVAPAGFRQPGDNVFSVSEDSGPMLTAARTDLHRWALDWDPDFYRACAAGIRREYQFWQTARVRPSGLCGYGHHETASGAREFYNRLLVRRLGLPADAHEREKVRVAGNLLAEAESGWDFCQRFESRCLEHSAVDLNALLAGHEQFLAAASHALGWGTGDWYRERYEKRVGLVYDCLWDQANGWFYDYDESSDTRSSVRSLAGLTPLFTGIASASQALSVAANVSSLEREHGIAATDERAGCRSFQWAYPNVWPCQVYVTVSGLARYGHHDDAVRIASKYVQTTDRLFEKTGMLWEKTDAETGELAGGEYDAVPMLGWTAGTYVSLLSYLESRRIESDKLGTS